MLLERWKEPAWEDLAPWRPPETDTQQEDLGLELKVIQPHSSLHNRTLNWDVRPTGVILYKSFQENWTVDFQTKEFFVISVAWGQEVTQEREEVPVASSILRIDSDRLISFQSHERFTILSEGFVISRFAGIHDKS